MPAYKELEWLDGARKFKKIQKGKKFGIQTANGKIICKPKYKKIYPFVDGVTVVEYQKNIFSKVLLGIVTKEGNEFLLDVNCVKAVVLNRNVIAVKILIDQEKSEWAIFNSEGNEKYKTHYDACPEPFENGFAKVKLDWGWTFIDEKGRRINDIIYDMVSDFRKNGRAFVWKDGERIVLKRDGTELKMRR